MKAAHTTPATSCHPGSTVQHASSRITRLPQTHARPNIDIAAAAAAGSLERNLLPCAVVAQPEEDVASQPVEIAAAALAIPHPEKVMRDHIKGVNRKSFGYGGEDAYFYCHGK